MTTLPTKHVPLDNSLLGIGMALIPMISDHSMTMSELWNEARKLENVDAFDRFCEGLVLLFTLGAIELRRGLLEVAE